MAARGRAYELREDLRQILPSLLRRVGRPPAALCEVSGPIEDLDVPPDAAREGMLKAGMPPLLVDAMASSWPWCVRAVTACSSTAPRRGRRGYRAPARRGGNERRRGSNAALPDTGWGMTSRACRRSPPPPRAGATAAVLYGSGKHEDAVFTDIAGARPVRGMPTKLA